MTDHPFTAGNGRLLPSVPDRVRPVIEQTALRSAVAALEHGATNREAWRALLDSSDPAPGSPAWSAEVAAIADMKIRGAVTAALLEWWRTLSVAVAVYGRPLRHRPRG